MGENSKIEWTDHTFNPWVGCAKVHAGCTNCYAEADFDKRRHFAHWGPNGTRVLTTDENWAKPVKWNKQAQANGVRRKVFCASLADVFEDWKGQVVDSHGHTIHRGKPWHFDQDLVAIENVRIGSSVATLDDVRTRLFRLIDATPWLDWQLLTKRPENILRMWPSADMFDSESVHKAYWPNVQLGTSISDQASADKQISELTECRGLSPVLFVSIEPLLGPIDLDFACVRRDMSCIDWVIVGGESGPGARPMHPDWVRSLRDQCEVAGVPFLFKQWGEYSPEQSSSVPAAMVSSPGPGHPLAAMFHVGKKAAGRLLDGRTWDEFPIGSES